MALYFQLVIEYLKLGGHLIFKEKDIHLWGIVYSCQKHFRKLYGTQNKGISILSAFAPFVCAVGLLLHAGQNPKAHPNSSTCPGVFMS